MMCSGDASQRMAFCAQPASCLLWGRQEGRVPAQAGATQLACAQRPPSDNVDRGAIQATRRAGKTGKKKKAEMRPLQAASGAVLLETQTQGATAGMAMSDMYKDTGALPAVSGGRQASVSHGIVPTDLRKGSASSAREFKFDSRDLKDLVMAVQRMTTAIKDKVRLPISSEHIEGVLDLAQVWQRLLEAHNALSGTAGETARGFQTASIMAFKSVANGPATGGKEAAGDLGMRSPTWRTLGTVLENLSQVSKGYSDSAVWLYSKAAELNPSQMSGAVMGISQATLDTIGLLNRRLESLLNVEVVRVLERFDRELLGIKRPNTNCKESATCMVLGEDGGARVLQYGEAIPQLLYDDKAQTAFSSAMSVVLNTDDKGNLFLSPPGSHGVELPLSSDVMWTRQMAAYAASVTGTYGEKIADDPAVPATVAAVTIPVNGNGDVLVTQRAFRGMYDGMWVFPGGHVDKGESLIKAATREVNEETGLTIDEGSLQPLAVWEGAVSSRKKQFCVVFFAADAMCENALACSMELQTKEVHRAAWVSRELLPRILDTHVLHSELEIDGVLIEEDEQHDTKIKMSELQNGLGEGHKFALRAYLEGLEAGSRPEGDERGKGRREKLEMAAPLSVGTAEPSSLEDKISNALRGLGTGLLGTRGSR